MFPKAQYGPLFGVSAAVLIAGLLSVPSANARERGAYREPVNLASSHESNEVMAASWDEEAANNGCTEDWREFYWAKRLKPNQLLVACMTDKQLIVAPNLMQRGVPGASGGLRSVMSQGLGATDFRLTDVSFIRAGASFNFIVEPLDDRRSILKTYPWAEVILDNTQRPILKMPGTKLRVAPQSDNFGVCGWPEHLTKPQVINQGGPFVCGPDMATRPWRPFDMHYLTRDGLYVRVRFTQADRMPEGFDYEATYQRLWRYTETFRRKE